MTAIFDSLSHQATTYSTILKVFQYHPLSTIVPNCQQTTPDCSPTTSWTRPCAVQHKSGWEVHLFTSGYKLIMSRGLTGMVLGHSFVSGTQDHLSPASTPSSHRLASLFRLNHTIINLTWSKRFFRPAWKVVYVDVHFQGIFRHIWKAI